MHFVHLHLCAAHKDPCTETDLKQTEMLCMEGSMMPILIYSSCTCLFKEYVFLPLPYSL